jgi:hypothetical protein
MALGNGRCDMVVKYHKQRFVLELKIRSKNYNHERALQQLTRYLDQLGEPHGYLIIFESKTSDEVPWDNRIKWSETEYSFNDISKKVTIVEM